MSEVISTLEAEELRLRKELAATPADNPDFLSKLKDWRRSCDTLNAELTARYLLKPDPNLFHEEESHADQSAIG